MSEHDNMIFTKPDGSSFNIIIFVGEKGVNDMKNEIIKNKVKVFVSSRESSIDADGKTIHYERYRYAL